MVSKLQYGKNDKDVDVLSFANNTVDSKPYGGWCTITTVDGKTGSRLCKNGEITILAGEKNYHCTYRFASNPNKSIDCHTGAMDNPVPVDLATEGLSSLKYDQTATPWSWGGLEGYTPCSDNEGHAALCKNPPAGGASGQQQ
jgi:hypothetical protein